MQAPAPAPAAAPAAAPVPAPVVRARGTKEDVYAGTALRTPGGLTRADLKLSARGKVVSVRASDAAKARYPEMVKKMCERAALNAAAAAPAPAPAPAPAAPAAPKVPKPKKAAAAPRPPVPPPRAPAPSADSLVRLAQPKQRLDYTAEATPYHVAFLKNGDVDLLLESPLFAGHNWVVVLEKDNSHKWWVHWKDYGLSVFREPVGDRTRIRGEPQQWVNVYAGLSAAQALADPELGPAIRRAPVFVSTAKYDHGITKADAPNARFETVKF